MTSLIRTIITWLCSSASVTLSFFVCYYETSSIWLTYCSHGFPLLSDYYTTLNNHVCRNGNLPGLCAFLRIHGSYCCPCFRQHWSRLVSTFVDDGRKDAAVRILQRQLLTDAIWNFLTAELPSRVLVSPVWV